MTIRDREIEMDISKIPTMGWVVMGILAAGVLVVVSFLLLVLIRSLKSVNITSSVFSLTQKEQAAAEGRELLDNQMRNAGNHIGKLRNLIENRLKELYALTDEQKNIVYLLAKALGDDLVKQVRLDFVRNHIIGKTDQEMKLYADSKAEGYYERVRSYLSNYNWVIPEYDFTSVMHKDRVSTDIFKDCFYRVYSGGKMIAGGKE